MSIQHPIGGGVNTAPIWRACHFVSVLVLFGCFFCFEEIVKNLQIFIFLLILGSKKGVKLQLHFAIARFVLATMTPDEA